MSSHYNSDPSNTPKKKLKQHAKPSHVTLPSNAAAFPLLHDTQISIILQLIQKYLHSLNVDAEDFIRSFEDYEVCCAAGRKHHTIELVSRNPAHSNAEKLQA